jgi:hypothetical protein
MKNKIEDLRNHLFMQLERLNDEEKMKNPIIRARELETAKAIAEIGTVIVNTAKVEVDFLHKVGGKGTDFLPGKALPEGEKK